MDKVHIRNIFRILVPLEGSLGHARTKTNPFGVEFQNKRRDGFNIKFVCTDEYGNIREEPKDCFAWAKRNPVIYKRSEGTNNISGVYLRLKINQGVFDFRRTKDRLFRIIVELIENGSAVRSGTSTVRELFPKRREFENEYEDYEAVVPICWVDEDHLINATDEQQFSPTSESMDSMISKPLDESPDPDFLNETCESDRASLMLPTKVEGETNYIVLYNGNAEVVGNFRALNFYKASDINIKEDIRLLEEDRDCRASLLKINGVEYKFKQGVSHSTNKRFIGYIAQQIESDVPEAVQLIDGILHVDYESLIPYLSESVKQNYGDIQEISSEVERVKKMLDVLYHQFAGIDREPRQPKKTGSLGRSRAIAWTLGVIALSALVAVLIGFIYFTSNSTPDLMFPYNERGMLLELYEALRPNDLQPQWNFTEPHCTWQGITCNSTTGRVVAIDMSAFALYYETEFPTSIPAIIGNFTELHYLDLSLNNLGSTIPESIQNLKNLVSLYLNANNLVGTVPDLNGLPKLREVWLYFNSFNGSLEMLMQLPAVESLMVHNNPFNSTLPQIISKSLATLHLANCSLYGTIPESWTETRFIEIGLSENKLIGSIPCFGDSLLSFFGSANDFDGEFCGSTLTNIDEIFITDTKLTGAFDLPNTNLTRMSALIISDNRFTSFLPSAPDGIQGPVQCLAPYNSFKCPLPPWSELRCKATCQKTSHDVR